MSTERKAMHLQVGDRIVVQPDGGRDDFEATVVMHRGWGLVHGSLDIDIKNDAGDLMLYSIQYDAPVTVMDR